MELNIKKLFQMAKQVFFTDWHLVELNLKVQECWDAAKICEFQHNEVGRRKWHKEALEAEKRRDFYLTGKKDKRKVAVSN